jgi:hypothetical protein
LTPPATARPHAQIDSENALPLLALADELRLEPLRTACSEALVECLVTTNVAHLQDAAERYNAPVLLAAARSITTAQSNALGDLTARKLRLQRQMQRSTQLQKEEKAKEEELGKQIRAVEDQRSHEIEQLFRRNGKAEQASVEAGYPHAASTVRVVRPNSNNPYGWQWSVETFEEYVQLFGVSDNDDEVVEVGSSTAPPAKRPRGNAAGGSGNGAGGGKRRKPSKPEPVARKTYGSIMEAYEAAASGDVLKLLAGRHLVSKYDMERKRSWDNLFRKSVQIVADDGVSRDRVYVGISSGPGEIERGAHESAIVVANADIRMAGLTLVCAHTYERTGYMGLREGARLWLEGCEMR